LEILITGSTGLLGSEIANDNHGSIALSSNDCDLLSIRREDSLRCKIARLQKERGANIKTVIHCAARVGGVKANSDYVADFFDDNIKMNMNVLDACKDRNLKLVSVLSTCIYPDTQYVRYPLTEDQLHMGPPHESNFGYAHAKRMLEVQSRAYRKQFGCKFVCVIPNNLYGLNDNYDIGSSHVIPALIRKFYEAKISLAKEVTLWGTGNALREFTFARDAARIITWIAENYHGDDPVNIGCTKEISIKDLSDIIRELVGFNGEVVWDTSKPNGQFRKPTSNRRLRELGWKEDYTPLEDGLRETVQYFKDNYPNLRGIR
jgi:GDP-L-fucose synthase